MSRWHIPDEWKTRSSRFDRSRFYMCMMFSLFTSTLFLFLFPGKVPMVVQLNPGTTHLLAAVLCLGTGCCITGFSLGSRFFFPKVDLRAAYRLAIVATPANVSSLAMLLISIGQAAKWSPFLTAYSGASTLFIIVAHLWVAWDLTWELKRIDARIKSAFERVRDD